MDTKRRWLADETGIKSGVAIPIIHQGDVVAAILFLSFEMKRMVSEDIKNFSEFSNSMVVSGVTQNQVRSISVTNIFESILVHGTFH